jgi:hypothetical protein
VYVQQDQARSHTADIHLRIAMHKVDSPGHLANEFTNGDPSMGVPRTRLEAKWMNSLQRELVGVVEQAGLTLSDTNDAQIRASVILHVTTVAALRLVPIPPGTSRVHVFIEGFTASNDGGDGLYRWDPTSAAADDGDLVVRPSTNPATGRWLRVQTTGRYRRTTAEIAASVTPTNYTYPPGDIRRYGAVGDGVTNCSPAIQAACDQAIQNGATVVIPGNTQFYRCNSSITLRFGCRIISDGTQPTLRFYGVNGFVLAAGSLFLNMSGIELFGCDAAGGADPKTHSGIVCAGTASSHCDQMVFRDLYMRGWNRCIDWSYTWSSVVDNCTTLNCNVGLRGFGQCVNNHISNSALNANTGTHSIQLVRDGGTRGEGWTVSNCLLASGTYGVQSDGFLSLELSNCVIDLVTDTALDIENVPALLVTNCWIYAANYGVRWKNLRSPVDQEATISACRIETTAANGRPLQIGDSNEGISIVGGKLICGARGAARCLATVSATNVTMTGTSLVNPSSNASLLIAGRGFRHSGLTGNVTIDYLAPHQFTGTLTQCTTAPTAQIKYSEIGDMVFLQIPAILATSANTNAPTITGMPAGIRPLTQQYVPGHVVDNGVGVAGFYEINTSGVIRIRVASGGAFSAANNKGTNACTVSYRRF